MYDPSQLQWNKLYGLDFSSFHSPAELAAPSIDCFENELDQLDLLELEVTQVNNAFSKHQLPQSLGPPSSITQSEDSLSFYSELQSHYDMDFSRICIDSDYLPDPASFAPLPPTPPHSPKSFLNRSSFSDYAPPSKCANDFYPNFPYATPTATISPSNISPPQDKPDPRKKYKCSSCPRAFARAYNLKTHMATHDPNRLKPHVCPHSSCGRSFSRKHDLGRHLVSIHRDEDTSSHRSTSSRVSIGVEKGPRSWCDSCGRGFIGKAPACACPDVK